MGRLKDDSLILTHRGAAKAHHPRVGVMWIALVLVCLGLMLLSRLDHSYVRAARTAVADVAAPVLEAARGPLEPVRWGLHQASSYFAMVERFDNLERQNQELQHWKWRARELERQLEDLSALARAVNETDLPTVTARVIASTPGTMGNAVLLRVGRSHKVLGGHAVIDAGGLVGRVIEASDASARVLLITDLKSRIPVHVGAGRVRGLMMGDNGPLPRLAYLPENAGIKAGDPVVTSGVGGILPRGLRIGEVITVGTRLAVRPHARLDALDYVSVLLYAAPELELSDGPGARAVGRRAQVRTLSAPEVTP